MERNHRTAIQGVVTSVKMAKTIVVTVSTKQNDPLYAKRVGYSKKYYAHDEKGEAALGDTVTIMACRPMSKLKRFRLVSVDKKALSEDTVAAVEEALEKNEGVTTDKEGE
ncbi:MAG: 30S ribosomal protein S17 [Bacilli bacterium]|nr:30S ribosomal protein S17 [Bacilli bacterium]